jgi:hypothetical protein
MEFSEYLEIAVERLDIGRMLADSPPKLKQSVISFLAEYGVARTDDDVMAPISVHSEIGEKTTLQQTLAAEERVEDWNIVDELQLLPPEPSAGDEELLIWQQLSKS